MSNNNQQDAMPSVLRKIVITKQKEVANRKSKLSIDTLIEECAKLQDNLNNKPRGFADALRKAKKHNKVGIIAEVKKASPSKGVISKNFNPETSAKGYETAGASCLSVLTDVDYFQGSDQYLLQARAACNLPVLRKDFMIDVYQIYESYKLGADCILLIMACLDDESVEQLHKTAINLGMDVLIEVHTENELNRALQLPRSAHNIYGINNRDLNTFKVDLQNSIALKDKLLRLNDDSLIISESGIHSAQDVHLMLDNGINNFLIGEQFMKTDNPQLALEKLLAEI